MVGFYNLSVRKFDIILGKWGEQIVPPEKEQSYYDKKAIIVVKSTPVYTPPKVSNNKPSENESGKDGK